MVKMYTKNFLFTAVLIFSCIAAAQAQYTDKQQPHIHDQRCGTMEMDAYSRQRFPERGTLDEFERWLQPQITEYLKHQDHNSRLPVLTIPCVFHIITDGAGVENISAAQVQAQIDQLNIDYRDLAGSTDAARADCEIEFCLATLDPSDNILPEPGINRVTAYGDGPFNTGFIDGTIKPGTSWDPNNYMNVWICDIQGGVLGYAQFPSNSGLPGLNANGGAANTDGVVNGYATVGSVANPFPGGGPYNLGRTMTHEVGHWLGLRHIWGDGGCGVDDFCGDTPASDASNFGCPNHSSCSSPDMVENYMDYTDDNCMNIFTADQKARVRTVMSVSDRRMSLPNSTKCGVPSPIIGFVAGTGGTITEGTDCGFQDIVIDLNISMAPSANATVTFGLSGATTAAQGEDFDFFPASVNFPGGSTPTRQVTLRIYNDGIVEATELVEIDFAVATGGDAIAATGDLATHDVTINDDDVAPSAGGSVTILAQDFEGGALAPWTTQGTGGGNPSDRFSVGNTAAATSGFWTTDGSNTSQFAYSNDDDCNCSKNNDRLRSPVFSLAGAYTTATLTFDHAYSNRIVNGNPEIGDVQISTGGGYTTISTLNNTSTGGPGLVTTPWVRGVTVDLTPYIGQATCQVRFRYNDAGEWAYGMAIDNIVISGDAPVNIQTADNTVAPQNIPVDGLQTVHFYDPTSGDVMATIENLSTWNYQCTRLEVDRDQAFVGGPTAPFWDGNAANYLAAKTFFVAPGNNTPTGPYTITLYYTEAEIAAWEAATGKARTALKIVKVSNTPIGDVNAGNFGSYTIEQEAATITALGTGVALSATFNTGFSGFGIGDPGSAPVLLPMDLLEFTGKKVERTAELRWVTQNEENVAHYTLERSIDGVSFELINQQNAKGNGLKSVENIYTYVDQTTHNGYNYYRLGQVDQDGQQLHSKIISINMGEEIRPVLELSPNPVRNDMTVAYHTPTKAEISIEVFDVMGHKMLNSNTMPVEAGNNNILLNVSDYPAGMYILRIKQGSHASTKRFIKK